MLVRSKTCKGRFMGIMGYFFSVYCVYKMFMASINIIFQRERKTDPISKALKQTPKNITAEVELALTAAAESAAFEGPACPPGLRG